jgi:general secretion pathway protein C
LIPLPAGEGGGVAGFKLIAIKPESLFNKLRLQNQDIVTEVNGVSLKDASEGFKLYQALQEEREINIRVMRGETPMTFIIRVK